LEEINIHFELRVVATNLYEKVIFKFRNTKAWLEEINYNISVKKGCPLSLTLFSIYIDKLEDYLEEVGYVGPNLTNKSYDN
jgi:hypothetical protein